METLNDLPILFFADSEAWEAWLKAHYGQPAGIWLKFAKKSAPHTSVTYSQALDAALCYGWIDGQTKTYDDQYYVQKFTPRRTRSIWSKRNVDRVAALITAGKMRAPGLAEVEAAKKDGRWQQAYDSPSNMKMPDDFRQALSRSRKAQAMFDTLNKTNTYAFLWRLQTAKRAETRQARIVQFIAMLEEGKTFHPQSAAKKRTQSKE